MTLIKPDMSASAARGANLSLSMGANESARVRQLLFHGDITSVVAMDVDVVIEQRRINQFIDLAAVGLWQRRPTLGFRNTAREIEKAGLWPVVPIAKGETFQVTGVPADIRVEAVYDLYTDDEVQNTEPNGSRSDRYRLFQQVSNSATVTEGGDVVLDKSLLDALFPAFPGGDVVPSKTRIEILALFHPPAAKGTGAAHAQRTGQLKLIVDGDDITDQDLGGLLWEGNATHTGASANYENANASRMMNDQTSDYAEILVLNEPKVFEAGEELIVAANVIETATGGDFVADDIRVGLVMDVIRV